MKLILFSVVLMCLVYLNASSYFIDDCESCWKTDLETGGGQHMRAYFNCTDTNLVVIPDELFGRHEIFQCANIGLFKSEMVRIIIDITESCDVSEIPTKVFYAFENLNDLRLVLPTLTSLGAWADFESTTLESFGVQGKRLPELPASLFAKSPKLKNFHSIDIQYGRFDPDAFQKATNLEQIRITGASLTSLPRDMVKGLTNLKTMNLSGNSFTTVDVLDFSDCRKAQTLDLQRNKISELNEQSLDGITSFTHLYLSENQISQIAPKTFSKMQNLETLTLAHSKLDRLTKEMFEGLKSLKALDLNHSSVEHIEADTFSVMTQLEKLNLTGNSIKTLGPQIFNGLNALNILDLSFNKLEEFNMLYSLNQLTCLNLSNNNIVQLVRDGIDTTTPMPLRKLDLSYNPITELKTGIFDGLGSLNWLELAQCQLPSFDFGLLSHSTNLTVLNLSSKTMRTFNIPESLPFYAGWKGLYLDWEQANTSPKNLPKDRKRFPVLHVYLNRIPSDNFYTWGRKCAEGWDV